MRLVLRLGLVFLLLFLSFWGIQRVLSRDDWPAVRLRLEAGRSGGHSGWQFDICEARKMFLDRKPASLEGLFARIEESPKPLTVAARHHEVEDEWTYRVDEKKRVYIDKPRSNPAAFKTRLALFIRRQPQAPTARLTGDIRGRDLDGKKFAWQFRIGEGGAVTFEGKPFGIDDLAAFADPERSLGADRGDRATVGRICEVLEERLKSLSRMQAIAPDAGARLKVVGRAADRKTQVAEIVAGLWPDGRLQLISSSSGRGEHEADATGLSIREVVALLPEEAADLTVTVMPAYSRLTVHVRSVDAGWTLTVDPQGRFAIDGKAIEAAELQARLRTYVEADTVTRTEPVTVDTVLKANIPTPTLTTVSFPTFSFKQAFGDDWFEPKPGVRRGPAQNVINDDEVVIAKFDESPDLRARTLLPQDDPQWLPPVAERLPRNPAVVRGCDGIGQYGGKWRYCASGATDIYRKIGYESFIRFDPSGRVQPCLAYKWEVSDDNRVFTFYMRKGHRWSDGEPFTVDDIIFTCNDVLTSPYWGNMLEDWQKETDGSMLLYADDILDWVALAGKILQEKDSAGASPGKQIWKFADEDLRRALQAIAAGARPDEREAYKLTLSLNKIFRNAEFYDPAAWKDIDLAREEQELLAKGVSRLSNKELWTLNVWMAFRDWLRRWPLTDEEQKLEPAELARMNMLLFRAAYPGIVTAPERDFVKVEAVDDGTGDKSHIVRFTFKEPNSYFLEYTGTFMFYRIFLFQRKHSSRLMPSGSSVLNVIDVLDWDGFLEDLAERGREAEASVARQLWSLMSEPIKGRIVDRFPKAGRDDYGRPLDVAYKQEIVDDINRALESRQFYDPTAWKGVDLTREWAELVGDKGFSKLATQSQRDWANQLMVREDWLKRGVDDLNDEGLFKFNLAMLRVAYPGKLAYNREDALNNEAQKDPRKYATWMDRMRADGQYHPVYSPDRPILQAWRVVSEEKDRVTRAVRNPYYYRVDPAGNQLPYLDEIEVTKQANRQVRLFAMRSGNVDFQVRDLEFQDFTVLKQSEETGGYEVRLWGNDYCGQMTIYCSWSHHDPEYRELQTHKQFRQALSLALNRQQMIDIVWQGMGEPAQYSIPVGSKFYNEKMPTAYMEYDPERANRMLDALGLDKRASDGTRLLWSGKPLIMDVNVVQDAVPLEAVQLACDYWRDVGINAQLKMRSGKIMFRLSDMGMIDIGIHVEGGNYFGPLLAGGMAPTHPAESVQFPRWTYWLRSGGQVGEEPPDSIKDLSYVWSRVARAETEEQMLAAWKELTDRAAEELPVIAIMTSPGKVVYVKRNFKNVPKLALAGWAAHDPGNCCPESFYLEGR